MFGLAPILQHSPSILLARRDEGISSLHDLIGKKVMLLPGKKDADILAMFVNEGIPLSSFKRLDQTYNLEDLIERRTGAVSAYVTNEPWFLKQQGIEPVVISPRTYGVDFYSDCLFTTEEEVENHPHRVQTFLQASLQGWRYAMDHPEEIIDILLNHYQVNKDRDHLQFEAAAIASNMRPEFVQIGHMNPGRWQHILNTYASLGMVDAGFSLEGFLYEAEPATDYTRLWWIIGIVVLILFTDITMPQMTGDILATQLLRIRRDIGVILCTGYSSRISDEYSEALGIKAFIYKPVVKSEMAGVIRRVLDDRNT